MTQKRRLSQIEKGLYTLAYGYSNSLAQYSKLLHKMLMHDRVLTREEISGSVAMVDRFIYTGKRLRHLLEQIQKTS